MAGFRSRRLYSLIGARLPAPKGILYTRSLASSNYSQQERRGIMPKRTFQPNRRRRSKTHGFRTRMKTKSGQAVLSRRRAKGRKRVSVKPGFREYLLPRGFEWCFRE